jgi:hyaluronan synthase
LFTFLLQLRETLQHRHPLHLFTIFVAVVWMLWAVKVLLSRRYRPWTVPYRTTTSVVIPVVDEPPELFREVLGRIADQARARRSWSSAAPATPPWRPSAATSRQA